MFIQFYQDKPRLQSSRPQLSYKETLMLSIMVGAMRIILCWFTTQRDPGTLKLPCDCQLEIRHIAMTYFLQGVLILMLQQQSIILRHMYNSPTI